MSYVGLSGYLYEYYADRGFVDPVESPSGNAKVDPINTSGRRSRIWCGVRGLRAVGWTARVRFWCRVVEIRAAGLCGGGRLAACGRRVARAVFRSYFSYKQTIE